MKWVPRGQRRWDTSFKLSCWEHNLESQGAQVACPVSYQDSQVGTEPQRGAKSTEGA